MVGTSIRIFCVLGIALSFVMLAAAQSIAQLMNAPEEAFGKTVHYIQICGGGCICIAAYNLLSAIFRGMGDSRSPLVFVSIACVTNMAGDIILIDGFQMGAAGAAIATVAAQAVSVLLSVILIKKKGKPVRFVKENLSSHKEMAARIIRLGSPIALQDMCNEISYLIIIGLVNALGVEASAGVGIAEKLVIFILLIPMSYMQSISAFTSQNVGAGKPERARKAMWKGMGTALVLGGITAYISYFHGDVLSMLFVKNGVEEQAAVIEAAADFLKATSIECFVLSIAYCLTGYFNGCGRTGFVMLQGLCAIFLVKIPYAYYASRKPAPQLFDIGLSTAYAALFTLIVCLIYYCFRAKKRSVQ